MEKGHALIHRTRHDLGEYQSHSFDEMLGMMRLFTRIHRSQVSGDLWARDKQGEEIDHNKLYAYIRKANRLDLKPIMYTQKPVFKKSMPIATRMLNLRILREATRLCDDYTVNVSLTELADVDKAMKLGLSAVCILPNRVHRKKLYGKKVYKTPGGVRVVTCPGKYGDKGINCTNCGGSRPLCTRKERDYAIGFPADGKARNTLNILS